MKITNIEIISEAGMKKTSFYKLQRLSPRQVDLIRKGVVAERVLNQEVFDSFLKTTKGNTDVRFK